MTDSSLWHFTAEAEYGWSVNGYPNGFCLGSCAPRQNFCDGSFHRGGMVVCGVNDGDPLLGPRGTTGRTYPLYINNPQRHLDVTYTVICMKCSGTQGELRHNVVDHEYGHDLGSGHTGFPNCVMRAAPETKFQCQHDADAMWAAYAPHNEG